MQKILIVSYFFPPCNLPASQRVNAWAKHLHQFGYYPIIITRRWDTKLDSSVDFARPTAPDIIHEITDKYEVYYLPYLPNLRDRMLIKFGEQKLSVIRKFLSAIELIFQYIFSSLIPYNNIFNFAEEFVKKNRDIKKMIITGNPYNLFLIGYRLGKKYRIKWIADYRDAWSTSEINFHKQSLIFRLINRWDSIFEKRWVSKASLVTASSQPIANAVSNLTGTRGQGLYNGFVQSDFDGITDSKFDNFTITYIGTLYVGQRIELFLSAYKKFIDENEGLQVMLYFPGLSFTKNQADRVTEFMKGYEKYFECTERMERKKILEIEKRSHLLLHVAWNEKGIIASKIYEYIASGSYILVAPSDKSSIQEIVEASGCGVCLSETDEIYAFLKQEYSNYLEGKIRKNQTEQPQIKLFSREKQVEHLAALLDQI